MNQLITRKSSMTIMFKHYYHYLPKGICLLFIAAMILTGCATDSDSDSQYEIVWGAISPESASIAVGEQTDFSAIGITADGDSVHNANFDFVWRSSDPAVFTVDGKGTITGKAEGTAYCIVGTIEEGTTSKSNRLNAIYVGWDSASVDVLF